LIKSEHNVPPSPSSATAEDIKIKSISVPFNSFGKPLLSE
jgi:hypothetical protein